MAYGPFFLKPFSPPTPPLLKRPCTTAAVNGANDVIWLRAKIVGPPGRASRDLIALIRTKLFQFLYDPLSWGDLCVRQFSDKIDVLYHCSLGFLYGIFHRIHDGNTTHGSP